MEILGVSFDDPETNAKFVKEEEFPFRLLSDSDHKLAAAVGAASSPAERLPSRISYLVSAGGKVLKAYPAVNPSSHASEVLSDLSSAGK